MLTQALITIGIFVALLALVPLGIRWLQRRGALGINPQGQSPRLLGALAVGPQQRVVTVEVGPPGARSWLVLGVTPQQITCLHRQAADPSTPPAAAEAAFSAVLASEGSEIGKPR